VLQRLGSSRVQQMLGVSEYTIEPALLRLTGQKPDTGVFARHSVANHVRDRLAVHVAHVNF